MTRLAGSVSLFLAVPVFLSGLHAACAAHAQAGTPVPDREMRTAGGGKDRLLGDVGANVLVFFRPGQPRSGKALKELAQCQQGLAGKSIRWVAVMSDDSDTAAAAELVRGSKFGAPVLVDESDALYGSLGMALHPVLVIVDRDRKLAAFEPYRSVNFCEIATAHIRHVLREISDDALRAALEPPQATQGGVVQAARRLAGLAEKLLGDGKLDKALDYARQSVEKDAASASTHALLGDILAARGNCAEALPAFEKALSIDAANARAMAGSARCKASR